MTVSALNVMAHAGYSAMDGYVVQVAGLRSRVVVPAPQREPEVVAAFGRSMALAIPFRGAAFGRHLALYLEMLSTLDVLSPDWTRFKLALLSLEQRYGKA